jgi:hypothetical protein
MEKLPVNLMADKLNLLEKAHDYLFLLRLMGFALVVDMLLAAATGTNLWTFKWSDISARPGLLLLAVVAYGVVMTIGAALVSRLMMELLGWIVPLLQSWLNLAPKRPEPDPLRYVSWKSAEEWLSEQTDAARRAPIERQMAEWIEDCERWFSVVQAGWACIALIVASLWIPHSGVDALRGWRVWAPLALLVVPLIPCAHHVWVGVPGHGKIELPELAETIYRKRYPLTAGRQNKK